MRIFSFALGVAVGYAVGTRHGREQAETVAKNLRQAAEHTVDKTLQREDVRSFISQTAETFTQATQDIAENARKFTAAAASYASQAAHSAETVIDDTEAKTYDAASRIVDVTKGDSAQSTDR